MQISGDVDQSAGMLDDEAKEKGYALMCVAEPQSDCRIRVIEEVSFRTNSWSPRLDVSSMSKGPLMQAAVWLSAFVCSVPCCSQPELPCLAKKCWPA